MMDLLWMVDWLEVLVLLSASGVFGLVIGSLIHAIWIKPRQRRLSRNEVFDLDTRRVVSRRQSPNNL